ncbi:MAG: glycosyltransferase family 9 protein [Deltaproteobacteria bacterium]|nr:glycosyltransferase family 9 protein [Deltaproteobacteria bacterium]
MAKKGVIHDYGKSGSFLAALSNVKIPVQPDLHDVEQNLNLLEALGISPGQAPSGLTFRILREDEAEAAAFMSQHGIGSGERLLGIHAGAGPLKGKKWPVGRFVEVSKRLLAGGAFDRVLVFGGEEERKEKERIANSIGGDRALSVNACLNVTGAMIRECAFFVCNDSGLMHMAAAVGTEVLGIFGPTNWVRTAPRGSRTHFLMPEKDRFPCAPCLEYPYGGSSTAFGCNDDSRCMESIGVQFVVEYIEGCLAGRG